jgi:hypothetical protein
MTAYKHLAMVCFRFFFAVKHTVLWEVVKMQKKMDNEFTILGNSLSYLYEIDT